MEEFVTLTIDNQKVKVKKGITIQIRKGLKKQILCKVIKIFCNLQA